MVSPSVIGSYYSRSRGFRRAPRAVLEVYKICGANARKLVLVTVAEDKQPISRKKVLEGPVPATHRNSLPMPPRFYGLIVDMRA